MSKAVLLEACRWPIVANDRRREAALMRGGCGRYGAAMRIKVLLPLLAAVAAIATSLLFLGGSDSRLPTGGFGVAALFFLLSAFLQWRKPNT